MNTLLLGEMMGIIKGRCDEETGRESSMKDKDGLDRKWRTWMAHRTVDTVNVATKGICEIV